MRHHFNQSVVLGFRKFCPSVEIPPDRLTALRGKTPRDGLRFLDFKASGRSGGQAAMCETTHCQQQPSITQPITPASLKIFRRISLIDWGFQLPGKIASPIPPPGYAIDTAQPPSKTPCDTPRNPASPRVYGATFRGPALFAGVFLRAPEPAQPKAKSPEASRHGR